MCSSFHKAHTHIHIIPIPNSYGKSQKKMWGRIQYRKLHIFMVRDWSECSIYFVRSHKHICFYQNSGCKWFILSVENPRKNSSSVRKKWHSNEAFQSEYSASVARVLSWEISFFQSCPKKNWRIRRLTGRNVLAGSGQNHFSRKCSG